MWFRNLPRLPEAKDEETIRLIVISTDEDFYERLQDVAESCRWRIRRAATLPEVAQRTDAVPKPIVIYDQALQPPEWPRALRRLSELPDPPCVLLASAVADDYLLREVVENHGFDILPKSAPVEKIIHTIQFAWFWALGNADLMRHADARNP